MAQETIIWKSYGYRTAEELESLTKEAKGYFEEFYADEEITDEKVQDFVYSQIDSDYDDERINLNRELDGRVLCIANLGLWNGRRSGYKILGTNLKDVLYNIACDEVKIYADQYNIKAEGYHHDGSHYVEYREIREDRNIQNLLDKLYMGEPVSRSEVNYYTKSLRPYLEEIYGI